jgi:hypothetical protein
VIRLQALDEVFALIVQRSGRDVLARGSEPLHLVLQVGNQPADEVSSRLSVDHAAPVSIQALHQRHRVVHPEFAQVLRGFLIRDGG